MKSYSFIVVALFSVNLAQAAIKTERISYKHGGANLEGFLAYDDSMAGKKPGVLVVHEWWGHNDYVQKRAEQLAALGYVAFALDMYGKGVLATDYKKAGELAGVFKGDRNLMRGRAAAGLKVLKKQTMVDDRKIAAIGYCFGGTTVLEMARANMDVNGVVSFHGGLDTPNPQESKNIKPKVLALHGADDPYVKPAEVAAFEVEMRGAKADWQLFSYGNAVHGFTNASNGSDNSTGAAYNEKADLRSWEAMKIFFTEVFK